MLFRWLKRLFATPSPVVVSESRVFERIQCCRCGCIGPVSAHGSAGRFWGQCRGCLRYVVIAHRPSPVVEAPQCPR